MHLLPTLWFRNTWWMGEAEGAAAGGRRRSGSGVAIAAEHPDLGELVLHCDGEPTLLFTENETNSERLWGSPNPSPYVKDAFHELRGRRRDGRREPGPHRHQGGGALRARRAGRRQPRWCSCGSAAPTRRRSAFGADVDRVFAARIAEADEFYDSHRPGEQLAGRGRS